MKFLMILFIFCLTYSSAFCTYDDTVIIQKLKYAIENGKSAWQNEYNWRLDESLKVDQTIDSIHYHYLWYAKGQINAYEHMESLIMELESKRN